MEEKLCDSPSNCLSCALSDTPISLSLHLISSLSLFFVSITLSDFLCASVTLICHRISTHFAGFISGFSPCHRLPLPQKHCPLPLLAASPSTLKGTALRHNHTLVVASLLFSWRWTVFSSLLFRDLGQMVFFICSIWEACSPPPIPFHQTENLQQWHCLENQGRKLKIWAGEDLHMPKEGWLEAA